MNKKFTKYLVTLLMMTTILGCGFITKTRLTFPFDLMIGQDDLPEGFVYQDNQYLEMEEATSRSITDNGGASHPEKHFHHQIEIYPDAKAARKGYETWKEQNTTDGWTVPAELSFQPADLEDHYCFFCLQGTHEHGQKCKWLQLHKNLVIHIDVVINDEAQISLAAFTTILGNLDARLPADVTPMPDSDNRFLFDFK